MDPKFWRILTISLITLVLAGVIFFFVYFRVENVEVMASAHYTEEEIKEMILRGPLASNSVLAPMLYSKEDAGDIPFIEGFSVTQMNRNTIVVSVREMQLVGCIPYLDSYIYFDRRGVFVESSLKRDKTVPFFDGIQVNSVVKNEKLPIKGDTVLNTAVALATIFAKNETIPDHIEFDDNYQISLLYGDIKVQLGKDRYLEDKMARALAILPLLAERQGILHLENVTDSVKQITFEEEEIEITAENWNGGYDADGNYTGDGEYTQYGKHIGPKPLTELDYAIAAWPGGYDGEGDYTGRGEYDENGNYVGERPTQEMLDANGDWLGGYDESGRFIGSGHFDRIGNYLGPNPNETASVEETEEDMEEEESGEDAEAEDSGEDTAAEDSEEDSYDSSNAYDAYGTDNGYDSYGGTSGYENSDSSYGSDYGYGDSDGDSYGSYGDGYGYGYGDSYGNSYGYDSYSSSSDAYNSYSYSDYSYSAYSYDGNYGYY